MTRREMLGRLAGMGVISAWPARVSKASGLRKSIGNAKEKPPVMLRAAAFDKARSFLHRTARPLDWALFGYHFAHSSRTDVVAELSKFQNKDGGFASCLDADTRWRGSSPMGTMLELRIFNKVHVPSGDAHVKAAVRYLLRTFDYEAGYWHALPREAHRAPHAPWWNVNARTGKCDVESPVFPTAALAGYLRSYGRHLPPGFLNRITNAALDYLSAAPLHMPMPDVEALSRLVRFLPREQSARAVAKLRTVLAAEVVRDPHQWAAYGIQPLTFIQAPDSPFYAGFRESVAANLDYVVATQEEDGGWPLNWSWGKVDPIAWKVAEKEWRGAVTLEHLKELKAFHRIAHS